MLHIMWDQILRIIPLCAIVLTAALARVHLLLPRQPLPFPVVLTGAARAHLLLLLLFPRTLMLPSQVAPAAAPEKGTAAAAVEGKLQTA